MTQYTRIKRVLTEVYKRSSSDDKFLEEILPMRNKIKKGLIYSGVSEESFNRLVNEVIFENTLNESVLDPVNKTRCPDVFDKDEVLVEKVRNQILKIVEDFKNAVKEKFDVKDIFLIGSSTGFQYNETSDIDIDIVTNMTKSVFFKNFNLIPKGIMLEGTKRPINIFIFKDGDVFDESKCENIYDVQANQFIKKVGKENIKIPYSHVAELAQFFIAGCNDALSRFKIDKQEYLEYSALDPEKQEVSEKEKFEAMDRKLADLRADYDRLKLAHHVIFAFEKEAYEGWPFRVSIELENKTDPRYSINNLVYKYIDRFGILEQLDEAAKDAKSLIDSAKKEI